VSFGNIIMSLVFNIQRGRNIVFSEARVVKTTEAAASVASNVATALQPFTVKQKHVSTSVYEQSQPALEAGYNSPRSQSLSC